MISLAIGIVDRRRQAGTKMAAERGRALVGRAKMEDKVSVIRPRLSGLD